MFLSGVKFIDRRNREKAADDLKMFADESKKNDAKLWIFPEGEKLKT
jgi:nickel-dependent lactate racemase